MSVLNCKIIFFSLKWETTTGPRFRISGIDDPGLFPSLGKGTTKKPEDFFPGRSRDFSPDF